MAAPAGFGVVKMTLAVRLEVRCGGCVPPWRTLLLAAGAVSAYLALGPAPAGWVFDRFAISDGEWWRLLSGHWVHSSPSHAGWNIAALLLLGALFEPRLRWRLPLSLLIAALGVGAWLWWGMPELLYYCGLSGILNGLLALGLLQHWQEHRHPLALLSAAVAGLKIVVESSTGQALFTQAAWASVPSAHAAGYLSGLLAASGLLRRVGLKLPRRVRADPRLFAAFRGRTSYRPS
jgi:rhomboid family GlyGly-CTERM serine protease